MMFIFSKYDPETLLEKFGKFLDCIICFSP